MHANPDKALDQVPTGVTVVLLADEVITLAGDPISLQLSGHSHGGQVRLTFVGSPALIWPRNTTTDGTV
ncbi:MAG: hypothetical protein GY832_10885 [Chloroflexi bacterium]|nr:hypothetical protein [Chloroflexota bacterium]